MTVGKAMTVAVALGMVTLAAGVRRGEPPAVPGVGAPGAARG